jgi:predicted MFS family arabinose efflux permease
MGVIIWRVLRLFQWDNMPSLETHVNDDIIVFTGFGCSLSRTPMHTIIVEYFEDNPHQAVGIATSGICVGGVVLPMILQVLIESYSWRGTFIVLSAATMNICVSGALARPITSLGKNGEGTGNFNIKKSMKNIVTNIPLVLLYFQSTFFSIGMQVAFSHVKAAILEFCDASDRDATYGISVISGANGVGVVAIGIISFKFKNIDTLRVLVGMFTVMGVSLLLFPAVRLYPVLLAHCAIIGVGMTPTVSLTLLVLHRFVAMDDLLLAYGVHSGFVGIGAIVGPMVAGFVYDITRDYSFSFYIAGTSVILGNLLLLKPCISSYRSRAYTLPKPPAFSDPGVLPGLENPGVYCIALTPLRLTMHYQKFENEAIP